MINLMEINPKGFHQEDPKGFFHQPAPRQAKVSYLTKRESVEKTFRVYN